VHVPPPRPRTKSPRAFLGCFFTIFLLAGLGFLVPFFLLPVWDVVVSRDWRKVPCRILESRVDSRRGDKGSTTYAVRVRYEYPLGDRTYQGDRYSFLGDLYSSGYDGKAAVVRRLKPGTQTFCYVHPRRPELAVLDREFQTEFLFGLIPMVFVGVGAVGLFFTLRRRPPSAIRLAVPSASPAPGIRTLSPGNRRAGKFGCLLFVALFWNGITGVFAYQAYFGKEDGCLKVFVLPFIAVGLLIVGACVHAFLQMFNPRPLLRIQPGEARLGDALQVSWETSGRLDRVEDWELLLEATEEASYRRGTKTRTDKAPIYGLRLAGGKGALDLERGRVEAKIPPTAMHGFEFPSNKLRWKLHMKVSIPRWPDVDDDYPFQVHPQKLEADLGMAAEAAASSVPFEPGPEGGWELRLRREPAVYFPGERVEGELVWSFPSAGQTLHVRLIVTTSGRGSQDETAFAEETVPAARGRGSKRFSLKLPEGPYSFSGKLISLIWAVEASTEAGGATVRKGIVVSPTGEEIRPEPGPEAPASG
jgi:hypothetical protein